MFIDESTGTVSWKRVLDENGKMIASLHELYNGEWAIVKLNSLDWVVDTRFTSPSRAVTWLWKNRFTLGEPYSLYPEKEKASRKTKVVEQLPVVEETESEDLFWSYKQ